MPRGKDEFDHESLQDPEAVVKYLEALAEGFSKGRLTFTGKRGEMTLEPKGIISFNVSASRKRGKNTVNLSLSWKPPKASQDEDTGQLRISTETE